MESFTTGTAALTSYPTHVATLIAPRIGMFEGTGLPVAVDQRPRNAKLGRPPRGNHC